MKKLLKDTEIELINGLAKRELEASHMYLHLANCMRNKGFFGAEKFFTSESLDERKHYNKWAQFMNDMYEEISVPALDAVTVDSDSLVDALEVALEAEESLLEAYEDACKKDVSTKVLIKLYDFVEVQTKAVGEYADLLARIELTNEPIFIDQELGK
jgi:ferritin